MKPRSRSNRYRDLSDIDTASETEPDDFDFFNSAPISQTVAVVSPQAEAITKKTNVPLTTTATRMATRSSTREAHIVRMQKNNDDDVPKPRRRIQTPFHPIRTRRHVTLQKNRTDPILKRRDVDADQSIVQEDVHERMRRAQETEGTKLRSDMRSDESADMEGSKEMERHETAKGTVVPIVEETTVVPDVEEGTVVPAVEKGTVVPNVEETTVVQTVCSTTTTTVHDDVVVHESVSGQASPTPDDVAEYDVTDGVTNRIEGFTASVTDGVTVVPTISSTVVHSVSDVVDAVPAASGAEVPHTHTLRPPPRITEDDDDIAVTHVQPSRKRPSRASESERAERLKERRTLKMEVKEEEEDIVWIKDVVNNGSADSSLVNMEFDRLQFLKPIVKAEQSAMGMEGAGSRLAHSLQQAQTDSLAGVQLHSNEFLSPGEKNGGSNNNNNDNNEMKGVGEPAETVSIAANTETETVEQGDVIKKDNDQVNENPNVSVPTDDHDVFHRTPSPIFLRTQYGNVECPEGYGPDVVESDITEIKISSTHRELAINIFLRRLSAQSPPPPSVARPEPQFAPSRDHVDTKYGRIFMPEGFRCCRCRMNTTDDCGVDGQLTISILVEMEKKTLSTR